MAEYIKKDDAIATCEWSDADVIEDCWPGCDFGFSPGDVKRKIKTIPAADVAPVVHGRWEHGYYCYEPATQCSVCKVCLAKGHRAEKQFTYCPNCGAKMDGGTT